MSHGIKSRILIIGAAMMLFAAPLYAQDSASEDRAGSGPALDLSIPHITTVFSDDEIREILAQSFHEDLDVIEVEGAREARQPNTPEVWPGIAAPFWALLNPTQAWRIFLPLPPDQVAWVQNSQPDATRTYREPAAYSAMSPLPYWD